MRFNLVLLFLSLIFGFHSLASAGEVGFNLERIDELSQADFNRMRSEYGATTVRLSFAVTPLFNYNKNNFTWSRNEGHFDLLDLKLEQVKKAGMKAVVDPHFVFGSDNIFTLSTTSDFWREPRHGVAWADAVAEVAAHLEASPFRGVVWGIDLINEPSALLWRQGQGNKAGDPNRYLKTDINNVFRDMVTKIRKVNQTHRLIIMHFEEDFKDNVVQNPDFYVTRLPKFDRADAKNKLVFSTHLYWPNKFTFQGLDGRAAGLKWPGFEPWATEKNLEKRLNWIRDWLKENKVSNNKFFIGEWGIAQGDNLAWNGNSSNPSNGGRKWSDQVFNFVKDYHWAFHQYNGNPLLDVNAPQKRAEYVRDLMKGTNNTDPGGKVYNRIIHKNSKRLVHYNSKSPGFINTVTSTGANAQWLFVDAGKGYVRIEHRNSKQWLHYSHGKIDFVNVGRGSGDNTRWKIQSLSNGYKRIIHKTSGRFLHFNPSDKFVGTGTGTGDNTKWKLQKVN